MTDAAKVERILEGLDRGRRNAIAQKQAAAAPRWRAVRAQLDRDILGGRGVRGRAGRVSRALGGAVGERQVRRILAKLSECPIQSVTLDA